MTKKEIKAISQTSHQALTTLMTHEVAEIINLVEEEHGKGNMLYAITKAYTLGYMRAEQKARKQRA